MPDSSNNSSTSYRIGKIEMTACALATARNKTHISFEEIFLAGSLDESCREYYPVDVTEKVEAICSVYQGGKNLPFKKKADRLIAGLYEIDNCSKRTSRLVTWIRNEFLNDPEEVIERFREEQFEGVKCKNSHTKIIRWMADLNTHLSDRVKGQEEVIDSIVKILGRQRLFGDRTTGPLKISLSGPASSGKRLLVTTLAKFLTMDNGKPIPFKELDLGGFSTHQSWEPLFGFALGYSGARKGSLTGFVYDNPECLLYFSHLESAHANTIAALKPILFEGSAIDRYDDSLVDFSAAIIIVSTSQIM